MKIGILHHEMEAPEGHFARLFRDRGCTVEFYDVRCCDFSDVVGCDLVFNRVYSSVAAKDFDVLDRTVELLRQLEDSGVRCVNSSFGSSVDYSKYNLYKVLSANGVFTPPTIFVGTKADICKAVDDAIDSFGFPIVVKRNCGGKSYEVYRYSTRYELMEKLEEMFETASEQGYAAGFILQKFMRSSRDHDCRVGVVDGEFLFAYSRSLVSRESEDAWIASTSGGSVEERFEPTPEEVDLAIRAKYAAGVIYGESDVIMTEQGPCVIEINPTPGYFLESLDDLKRMECIVDRLVDSSECTAFNLISKNKRVTELLR